MKTRRNFLKFGLYGILSTAGFFAFLARFKQLHHVKAIIQYPNPILRTLSQPIYFIDESVVKLSEEIIATLQYRTVVDFFSKALIHKGISAPQIGMAKRLIACLLNGEIKVLLNPEVIDRRGGYSMYENCLSLSGHNSLAIRRSRYVKVKYQDLNAKPHTIEVFNREAVLMEHEIDHLNGVLYIDYIGSRA